MSIEYLFAYIITAFVVIEVLYRIVLRRMVPLAQRYWRILAVVAIVVSTILATIERSFHMSRSFWMWAILFLAIAWAATIRFMPQQSLRRHQSKKALWRSVWWVVTVLAIVWGSWVRIAAVDAHPLQGDEYFHVNTGKGYLETGEYVQWDWLTDTPQWNKPYTRAWPYSWQVAQSIRVFGEEEWALRLPALVWGVALLVLLPLLVAIMTRSAAIAALATLLVAFDPTMVWLSVFSRMYTMLFVILLLAVAALWKSLHGTPRFKHRQKRERWLWLSCSLALVVIGYSIHPVASLLLPAFGLYTFFLWLGNRHNRFVQQVVVFFVIASLAAAITLLIHPITNLHFIVLRKTLQTQYLEYVVGAAPLPVVAGALLIGALVVLIVSKRVQPIFYLCAGVLLPILLYFVVFANRYSAKKYVAFILFAACILIAWIWSEVWKQLRFSPFATVVLSTLLFLWMLVPFSLPGVHITGITIARADRSFVQLKEHDYPRLYAWLEEQAPMGSAFVLQGTKQYYLTRTDTVLYSISLKNRMTIKRIQEIHQKHEHGYVLISRVKSKLIQKQVRVYIQDNFERVKEKWIRQTNFIVYRW